ncbi:MAG TPA: universal stress protein, partial [Roseiflexaceae bacterium]|nr:universal stress protein [Roseiflexaceae bacterium]
ASTPVFLVRATAHPPAVPWSLRRIMVPLDGSALAERALPTAIDLATRALAELLLFHAVSPPARYLTELAPFRRSSSTIEFPLPEHQQALQRLQAVAERWHDQGITILPVVTSGEPAQEIVGQAARQHVDLIVLATHGYGGLRRWALGSVADKLLHAAEAPLLLMRN